MFMAVTVVAVVIFLCGVMVGRGVKAPRAIEQADAATESPVDPTDIKAPVPPAADAASPSTPAPSEEKLTYADHLTGTPPPDPLKEPLQEFRAAVAKTPAADPLPLVPTVKTPTPVSTIKTPKPPAAGSAAGGYVVQVTAVKERGEADQIAKRLASKGFKSFVTSPGAGAAKVYRVRVGTYSDLREAQAVARRLEKEEQFKPWITR
jgi:cell division protein FtsN